MNFSIRLGVIAFASVLSLWLLPMSVRADEASKTANEVSKIAEEEASKFSDDKVREFVKGYVELVYAYRDAYGKATKDPNDLAQLKGKVEALKNQVTTVGEKLQSKPAEAERFEQFVADYTQKMIDATK
jgi:polyhydroxyalkanoate synthesis regulator phasin